jgi:hypothetical protein
MSHYVTITRCDLQYINSNSPRLNQKDYHYHWYNEDVHIYVEDRDIKWSDEFMNDLLHMIEEGIWGAIETRGEENELTLFELTEEGVEESFGHTTYSDEPDVIHKVRWQ